MSDACTSECLPAHEGDYITCDDPIFPLDWDGGCTWIIESDGFAPGEEMNLPGLASKSLLVMRGSMDPVCNSASIIEEMMSAFGR